MKLHILGSSSAGNCYVFDNGKEALVIECGVAFKEVKKAVSFDISRIVGVLISHEHKDHAAYVEDFLKMRINCYSSEGTIRKLIERNNTNDANKKQFKLINEYKKIGNFKIKSFKVFHNAEEPIGFLIFHKEMGTVLFATDCNSIDFKFKNLNNILIECNHSIRIITNNLKKGLITEAESVRILRNHMSIETCIQTLKENDLRNVNNIVLIHLSEKNSNAKEFKEEVQIATCKNVLIAEKNMTIELNKMPF